MHTRICKISDLQEQQEEIEEAGRILAGGGLVAFPTETVYGLGANGFDADACAAIYEAKGRPSDNPLILHVSDRKMVDRVAADVPELAERLFAAFCPGPITIILHRRACVPGTVTGGLDTVGIRMPEHDIARAMIRAAGVPIAAPSANLSGRPSPTTAQAVYRDMQGRIPLILDGGSCRFGVESTIVEGMGEKLTILRPGAITREMLAEVAGDGNVSIDPAIVGVKAVPKAPGMKYTHYAPKAPLTLIEGVPGKMIPAFRRQLRRLAEEGQTAGIIVSDEVAEAVADFVRPEFICRYGAQGALPVIAANLYEALRSFDDKPIDCLLAEGTAECGLGLAIMNRLHKASGFRSIQA